MSDDLYYDEDTETAMEKIKRLFYEHKVVSAGVGLTIAAFIGASYGVRTGRREFAQHMFRARVGFQFFTLTALLGGGMFYDKKRKEDRLMLEQNKVALLDQEKNA
ncbi:Respiratory supercomplex factor 1, mitochondrial [Entomortierella chlamydospora]|uniref:Respiratory supercomplex factor 1, mitochondrial n=1 Tax=Entomortierella chlamydospora TaxID=101097 RepID=A0A9P6MQ82_9FUNG|nr:Respiratory supercomplex factor 1, mitochondrial [Entomortierella chlamydospora]KAG0009691.1 Respiratory supercomplex factor 1, mitochondrial [Entomortierella chlamydospora]